jgi:hypothetical protein
MTFDRRYYDFQAVGEFVDARSASGDLEIQTRQQPFADSMRVSVNTAVGLRVGSDRLSLTMEGGDIAVVLNDRTERWERGTRTLPGGGKAARRPSPITFGQDGYTIRWPDGSRAWIDVVGRWALRLFVALAPERAGTVTGLLGNFDADPGNDLVRRDGQPLGEPTFDHVYPGFADSWRIHAGESLFTYAPGQDTASFTDRRFPERAQTVADLPADRRDRARSVCVRAGVTDPAQLDACVLDVGVTGEPAFAVNSGDVQQATVPPAPPVVAPEAGDRTLVVDRPGGSADTTLPGTAGQRLFVTIVTSTLPSSCGVLQLRAPSGEVLAGGCIINGAGVVDTATLPVTGTYTLRLDPEGNATGRATIRVFHPVDESAEVTVDGPAVTATIAIPGAASRLSFAAARGQRVFVDVASSTLPDECGNVSLLDPQGKHIASGCVINGVGLVDATSLPFPGRYTILVDPGGSSTGRASVRLTSVHDQSGEIAIGGPAVTSVIGQPGARTVLRFTGTAGQQVVVEASGSSLPHECGLLSLFDAGDHRLAGGCVIGGSGRIDATRLPASGAYTIVVDPGGRATGSVTLRVHT